MNKIYIDGDILCYRSSSSVQRDIDWGDGLWTTHAYLSDAIDAYESTLSSIKEDLVNLGYTDNHYVFCFSDRNNFRKTLNKDYKSNRVNHRKPTCYSALLNYINNKYSETNSSSCSQVKGLEGDDVIGIYSTLEDDPEKTLIVSMDKDFKTIPCCFYNFKTKEFHSNYGDYNKAFWYIMYQTLVGDVTDGYRGAPSVGKKRAMDILKEYDPKVDPKELWETVVTKGFKGDTDSAVLQYRMAHLLWYCDYDFKNQELSLRTPEELIETIIK